MSSLDEFGFGLPTISIVSTELISDISSLQAKQDPHIDHPGEISVRSLKKIDDTNENRSLKVRLRLSFKETIDPNGDFAYINAGKDLKYFKVAVFQSLDFGVTDNCNYNTLNPRNGPYFNNTGAIKGLSKQVGSPGTSLENITNLIIDAYNNAQQSNSALDFSADALVNNIPYAKTQDSSGNTLYDIPLLFNFDIKPKEGGSNPDHLAYFVFSYFDVDEYLKDVKETIGQVLTNDDIIDNTLDELESMTMGNITSDIVILNGQLQEEAYIFQDSNLNYYTGPYHQMSDGQFMKGAYHLQKAYDQTDYLNKITVPNSKIIDNREIAKLDKVDYNYAKVADFLINPDTIQTITNPGTEGLLKIENPVFSKMWSSHDITGKNRFLFSINMESLLLKSTVYPGLLTSLKKSEESGNGVVYSSLLSQVQIKELKITRRRVKDSINLDSKISKKSYSKNDKPLLIVHSVDQNGKLSSKVEISTKLEMRVSNAPKKVATISEVNIDKMNKGLRTFSCTDINVSEKAGGLYEYTVELEVSDPIPKFLQSKIQELEILLYGNNSSKGWSSYLESTKDSNYFDSYSNRFNVQFLDLYNAEFNNTEGLTFVSDIIFKFMSLISQLDAQNSLNNPGAIIKAASYLIQISDPNTGNPVGVETVAEFMDNTISSLQGLLQNTTSYKKMSTLQGVGNSHVKNSTPKLNGASSSKTFKISHTFKELFEASNTSRDDPFGYDFLSTTQNAQPTNLGGLRTLNVDDYINRCTLENKKLFLNEDVDFEIAGPDETVYNPGDSLLNRKFCFLSPSFVYVPKRAPGNLISNNITVSEAADLALDIIRYNKDSSQLSSTGGTLNLSNSPRSLEVDLPEDTQKRRLDLVEYLASKGATFKVEEATSVINQGRGKTSTFPIKYGFNRPSSKSDVDDFLSDVKNIFHASSKNILNSAVNPNRLLIAMTMLSDMEYKIKISKFYNYNNITYYDLSDIDRAKRIRKKINSEGVHVINGMPNHTKSLIFLSKTAINTIGLTTPITKYFNKTKKDPFKVPHFFPYINFNYRVLNKIQVFNGFDSPNGSANINGNGKWKDLSLSVLNKIENGPETKYYLCRQVRFVDSISVKPAKAIEMPFYDEYFLLTNKELNIFPNPESFEAFFSNDITSGAGVLEQQTPNALFDNLMHKENRKVSKTGNGGYLKTEFMQTNIGLGDRSRPPSNDISEDITTSAGLTEGNDKFKAARNLSLLEQAQILDAMGLSKMLRGNNVNSNIAKLKNEGTTNREGRSLTEQEAELLKNSSVSKQTKQQIDKAIKIKAPTGTGKADPVSSRGGSGGGTGGGGSGGGTGGGGSSGGGGTY